MGNFGNKKATRRVINWTYVITTTRCCLHLSMDGRNVSSEVCTVITASARTTFNFAAGCAKRSCYAGGFHAGAKGVGVNRRDMAEHATEGYN